MALSQRKDKTIVLPFSREEEYNRYVNGECDMRQYLMDKYKLHPELFPAGFQEGFHFHGVVSSKKLGIMQRRIRLKADKQAYQLRPSLAMPYMIGRTDEMEKALFLRYWGVPSSGLAYVFGHDEQYWYRAFCSLGRNSLVGSTVKADTPIPVDVCADEKHTRRAGKKGFIATTTGQGCFLGAALTNEADTASLTTGYGEFLQESRKVEPDYQPNTVNTDGWEPTQQAWKTLFPRVVIVLCFFHAWLSVKKRCRRAKELLKELGTQIWTAFRATSVAIFAQRIRRLREWTKENVTLETVKEKVLSLCQKASSFKEAYKHEGARRTSNEVDRLMNFMDRVLYAMQYFHGTKDSGQRYIRAVVLLWNFHPYCPKGRISSEPRSPFEQLNGFQYHHNWLHNFLIASSLQRRYRHGESTTKSSSHKK